LAEFIAFASLPDLVTRLKALLVGLLHYSQNDEVPARQHSTMNRPIETTAINVVLKSLLMATNTIRFLSVRLNTETPSTLFHSSLALAPIHRESKKYATEFLPYLHQILTDFQSSFTSTLSGKFAVLYLD